MKRVVLDGKKIHKRSDLHNAFREQLSFPDYYGDNLDALFDELTTLQETTEVEFVHTSLLKKNLGRYAEPFWTTLVDAAEETHNIIFVIEADDPWEDIVFDDFEE